MLFEQGDEPRGVTGERRSVGDERVRPFGQVTILLLFKGGVPECVKVPECVNGFQTKLCGEVD